MSSGSDSTSSLSSRSEQGQNTNLQLPRTMGSTSHVTGIRITISHPPLDPTTPHDYIIQWAKWKEWQFALDASSTHHVIRADATPEGIMPAASKQLRTK